MAEVLDKVVSFFVEKNGTIEITSEEEKQMIFKAAKEQIKNQIVEEIKNEAQQEIIDMAQQEIEKAKNAEKLKELKEIVWSGFILAFLVGLLVNQVTEIIGYVKGIAESVSSTYWISLVLVLLCGLVFIVMFFGRIMKMYNDIKNGTV